MGVMEKRAADARRKAFLQKPQWDELLGRNEPAEKGPVLVALDPAKSTGWCVLELTKEDRKADVWHGQCDLRNLGTEMGPIVEGRPCLVVVERGYISWPKFDDSFFRRDGYISQDEFKIMAEELRNSERSMITFLERCGKILGWADANLICWAPVWRPTATQWRALIRDFKGVKGRANLKETAVSFAERITGDPFKKQRHWVENQSRRFGVGKLLDDEADAVCIAYAALKFFGQKQWTLWSDI